MTIDTGFIKMSRAQAAWDEEIDEAKRVLCKDCNHCYWSEVPIPEFGYKDAMVGYCDYYDNILNREDLLRTVSEMGCL